jgi:Putative auto-transporter adhesin, head GIN domain
MRIITLAAFLLVVSSGCHWAGTVTGNGNLVTEKRSVSGFTKISAGGPFDVVITPGPTYSVQIEADDNLLELINLDKDGKVLKIKLRNGVNVRTRNKIRISISMPELDALSCAGSGHIKVTDLVKNDNRVDLDVAGSGEIDLDVNTPKVSADIAGSGTIKVKGQTKEVDLDIAGSGDYRGQDLLSENVKISIAGSGTAYVHASQQLNVSVAGSGDVYYAGSPTIKKSVAGSGNVRAVQ